jgi:hypothetical protein
MKCGDAASGLAASSRCGVFCRKGGTRSPDEAVTQMSESDTEGSIAIAVVPAKAEQKVGFYSQGQ